MPIKDLMIAMARKQEIDNEALEIAKGLPYRDFITAGLLVKKLNLKNKTNMKTMGNIVPDCWIYVQEPEVKMGRIQIFNNWSPYLVKDIENTVWIGVEYFANEGDELWSMTEKEFTEFASKELVSMGIIENGDVISSHQEKVKKAYPAYFDTYKDMDKLIKYLDTYENLYCVGRNGQHRYNNMDHSMATAIEVVKNIKSGEKSKDNIWNVNTEKEYHETKK
jgi:protoporphyrinogen oxidase